MKKVFAVVVLVALAGACGGKNKSKNSMPDNKGGAGSAMGGSGYGGASYGGGKPEAGGGGY